jgi:hypothetical protein
MACWSRLDRRTSSALAIDAGRVARSVGSRIHTQADPSPCSAVLRTRWLPSGSVRLVGPRRGWRAGYRIGCSRCPSTRPKGRIIAAALGEAITGATRGAGARFDVDGRRGLAGQFRESHKEERRWERFVCTSSSRSTV